MAGYSTVIEDDFSGGINTTDAPQKLANNEFVDILNLFVYGDAESGATLRHVGGNRAILTASSPVHGFTRFRTSSAGYIVYATNGTVRAFNISSSVDVQIDTGGSTTNRYEFAVLSVYGRDRVFWVDGASALKTWDGTGTAETVGILAPTGTPTLAVAPPPGREEIPYNLNTKNLAAIQYYVTYSQSSTGLESNPGPVSLPIISDTPFACQLTAIPISPDARVNQRNLYRVGGTLTVPHLVHTINDNTTTSYLDDTSDYLISDILLNFSHDLPPVGCQYLRVFHGKNRLVMIGDPNAPFRWYYSSEAAPDYWPQGVITNPLTDGGYKDIDADRDNTPSGFCSSGSSLVIGRSRGIYFVTGDTGDDFAISQVAGIGVISGRTLVQCGNTAVWQGQDGNVYALGGDAPIMLSSVRLRKALEALEASNAASLKNACACFWREKYVLCVPQGSGQIPFCYAYDFPTQAWTSLSDHTRAATQLYAESGQGANEEILIATELGYTDASNTAFTGIAAICSPHTATNLPIRLLSGNRDYGRVASRDGWFGARLWGSLTLAMGNTPTLTFRAFSGASTFTKVYNIPYTSGILLDKELTKALCGNHHNYEVNAIASAAEIQSVEIDIFTLKAKGRRRA